MYEIFLSGLVVIAIMFIRKLEIGIEKEEMKKRNIESKEKHDKMMNDVKEEMKKADYRNKLIESYNVKESK